MNAAGTYHLSAAAGRFRWTHDHQVVATAAWREHCWDLYDCSQGSAFLSVVAGSVDGHTRVALVDHPKRSVATYSSAEPMTREHIGIVRDNDGALQMLIRADGPTGLHVIDPTGRVLAITSRRRAPEGTGCDLLVTPAGEEAEAVHVLFGLTLALELLRTGRLRHVA